MENKDFIFEKRFEYMNLALDEAKIAFELGEVPVGAVIVSSNGGILTKTHNIVEKVHNALCHAEIIAIEEAMGKIGEKYLMDCSIFVTLEPCLMCATAISLAKIRNVYFATVDEKGGAVVSGLKIYDNAKNLFKPNVFSGIMEKEASSLLKDFFKNLRNRKK